MESLFSQRNLWIGVLVVASLGLFAACKKASVVDESTIIVGEFGSLTGNEATFGISTHNGIQMVIDDVNAAGGVNGKKLKLITLDDEGKPEVTVNVVTRLVAQDKVHVLLGEVASSRSLAAAPLAQRNRIPMISPSSTNPKVTGVGDFIFRVCFTDPFQGQVVAQFAADDLKAKKAALLVDRKSDYSVGLADYFKRTFTSTGGTIVAEESYSGGDIDFKAQLTSLRSKGAEVVMVPGYYTEVGLIVKQARELGMKIPFLGGDGWDSPKLFEIAGKALENTYIANHYSVEDKDPKVQDFVKRYKARFNNEVPDGLAAMGYDAALVMVDALKRAKSVKGDDIRDALAATQNFPGVTGTISIDGERNAKKPAVILKVDAQGFRFVRRVEPI